MAITNTKWSNNIPNGPKIYKYMCVLYSKLSKIYPSWYENIPSANPVEGTVLLGISQSYDSELQRQLCKNSQHRE
jgi:hypothetical protein